MIYTFYSYKGGVGRTMALANVAELFYQAGYKVLMVDWDLEAPGLERYFPSINLHKILDKPGLIDMILRYKEQMTEEPEEDAPLEIENPAQYIIDIYPYQSGSGKLSLLTAGRRSKSYFADYARAVLTFDWQDFYETWEGELYFNWLREQFEEIADVILIDSRTGVTEMGGVCTYHLADIVVMFCAPNQQNLEGAYDMALNFTAPEVQRLRSERSLQVLVIPARIERAEGGLLDQFQERFINRFKDLTLQTKLGVQQLWKMGIPYIPKYAFTELVAVRESGRASADDMVMVFGKIFRVMRRLKLEALLRSCTVRVLTPSGEMCGNGFVISEDVIVTCAHVIEAANSRPGETVNLSFTLSKATYVAEVLPDAWSPVNSNDIAILRLRDELPHGMKPAILGPSDGTTDHSFLIPHHTEIDDTQGLWTEGKILGLVTNSQGVKVLQLDSQQISPRMSGAPVLDTNGDRVIGILTIASIPPIEAVRISGTAFATPTEAITKIWPLVELISPISPSNGSDRLLSAEDDVHINKGIASSVIGDVTSGGDKIHIFYQAPSRPIDPETLAVAQQRIAAIPTDTLPEIASLPPGSRVPFAPNPLFVDREEHLKALAAALKGGSMAAIGQVAATTGLGGIGKTQLAAEFVHRYGQFFVGGIFWLSFADPNLIPAEIADCGRSQYLDLESDFNRLDLTDQLRLVLAVWQSPLPRLLIFDNCEEEALLQQWRPPSGGCRVLITSRRASWSNSLGVQTLPLETLPRTESIVLLRKHRPDLLADDSHLDAIAAELGDLPLALHLAGSYLEYYRDDSFFGSPANFLEELRDAHLLDHPALQGQDITPSPTGHLLHLGRTFTLSYNRLNPADPTDALALQFLVRAAYFAPGQPIPRLLLLATLDLPTNGPNAARQTIRALRRLTELGLLTPIGAGASSGGSLLLHRLLPHFIQQVIPNIVEAQTAVERSILQALDERRDPAGYLYDMLPLQAHLRFLADTALLREDKQAALLSNWAGYYLSQIGDYWAARPYVERALAIYEKVLGPDHPDTARSLNNLASLLQALGDYAAARPCFERALDITEKVLGAEHPDTAQSLNNLGLLLQAQGEYAQARPYFERALAITEKVLGAEHPDTAQSLNNLGLLLQAEGVYTEAQQFFVWALAIREKVLGAEHPDTAQSLNNLGYLLQAQWAYAKARPYLERALVITEKVLGAEHPDTAQSLNNLGLLLQAESEYAQARPYFERALAIRQKVFGEEHPDTASILDSLGFLQYLQGEYAEARPYFERALTIREKVLGAEHPDTAFSLNNLGLLFQAESEYAEARPYFERALAIRQKVLGEEHLNTALSLNNLGLLLQAQGEYTEARPYLERALTIREKVLGTRHPDTAFSLNNLGSLLQAMGELASARPYFEQALAIYRRVLGENHPNTAQSLNNLGSLLQAEGNYIEARSYLAQALVIYTNLFSMNHLIVQQTQEKLAKIDEKLL